MVFGFSLFVTFASLEGAGHGLSTRMQTDHIHKGSAATAGFVVGWTQPGMVATSVVRLRTDAKLSVFDICRADKMCDLAIPRCNRTDANAAECLCERWGADATQKQECKHGAEGMNAHVHAGNGKDVKMHFASSQDQARCRVSYMNDATVTTNEGADILCTQAPQVLGMVLSLLIFCCGAQNATTAYQEMKRHHIQTKVAPEENDTTKTDDKLKAVDMLGPKCDFVLSVVVLLSWFVYYIVMASSRADDVQKTSKITQAGKYQAMFYQLDGTTVTMAMKDDVGMHYTRAEGWGSWWFGFVLFVVWSMTNGAAYVFDFRHLYEKLGRKLESLRPVREKEPDNQLLLQPAAGEMQQFNTQQWNLQGFGLSTLKTPSYSLLVSEAHGPPRKVQVRWSETSNGKNELNKNLMLVTIVLLTVSIVNHHVLDVNLWNVLFAAVGYVALDTTFRRTNELLYFAHVLKAEDGPSGVYVWVLGSLLKFLVFLLGVAWLLWEYNMSPRYGGILVAKEVDKVHELTEHEDWFYDNTILVYSTLAMWGLVWALDAYLDYQYVGSNKFIDTHIKKVEAMLYFFLVVHISFFIVPTLVSSPAATAWKEFTSHPKSDDFTAYEWDRNNWIYGISRQ